MTSPLDQSRLNHSHLSPAHRLQFAIVSARACVPVLALSMLALSMLVLSMPVAAEGMAAGGGFFHSADAEGFNSRRLSVDGTARFEHLDSRVGLRYTDHEFSRSGWSRQGQQLRLVARDVDRKTLDGWTLEPGLFRAADKDVWTLDASWRRTLSEGRAVELFANRDFVETANAIERGISYDFVGASGDYQWAPKWTTVGLAGLQNFSDGNQRRHLRARLIFQPSLDLGLTTQVRFRWFDSSRDDVAGAYFNPSRYRETLLALGWRQKVGDWRNVLTAGFGRQAINDDSETNTRLAEASAEKQVAGYALRMRAGYVSSASLASSDPNYWYRYVSFDLLVPF